MADRLAQGLEKQFTLPSGAQGPNIGPLVPRGTPCKPEAVALL